MEAFYIIVKGKFIEARPDKAPRGKKKAVEQTWNKARALSDDGKLYDREAMKAMKKREHQPA